MDWPRLLAYITGTVDQELLLRNEYLVAFIHLGSRKVCLAGMTPHPDEEWMRQMARNVTLEQWGFLGNCRYLLHDRDGKFFPSFDESIESAHTLARPGNTNEGDEFGLACTAARASHDFFDPTRLTCRTSRISTGKELPANCLYCRSRAAMVFS